MTFYFIFNDSIAILVYYGVNKIFWTYLYSTDDKVTFEKACTNFNFSKKHSCITILINLH